MNTNINEVLYLALFALTVALVAPFISLMWYKALQSKISELEAELHKLKAAFGGAESPVEQTPTERLKENVRFDWRQNQVGYESVSERPAAPPPPIISTPPAIPPVQAAKPAERIIPRNAQPLRAQTPSPTPAPAPGKNKEQWEMLIGGRFFLRIGAIALIIGVGYGMQMLSNGNLIPPWLRVLFGFICGGGLVLLGNHFHKRGTKYFAQGLMGAGIGVLYVAAYSSFKSYQLVPQASAIFLMSAVTAIAIIESLRYDSLLASLLGLIGGYLTPALVGGDASGAQSNWFGLFTYIALLNAGLLTVAIKKDKWPVIEPLVLIFTYLTYIIWHSSYYTSHLITLTVPFLVLYWIMFYVVDIYRIAKSTSTSSGIRTAVAIANTGFFYTALYYDINDQLPKLMPYVTLALCATYFVTMLALIRKRRDDQAFVSRYTITAIVLLVIATALQFHERPMLMATLWAVEALGLIWAGIKWGIRSVIFCALALSSFSVIMLLSCDNAFAFAHIAKFKPILNIRFLAYSVISATLAAIAILFARSNIDDRQPVSEAMHFVWVGLVCTLIGIEINDYFTRLMLHSHNIFAVSCGNASLLIMGLAWGVYSLALVTIGLKNKIGSLTYGGLGVFVMGFYVVVAQSMALTSTRDFLPIINIRALALAAAFGIVLLQRSILNRHKAERGWINGLIGAMEVGAIALGFELITMETLGWFSRMNHWSYIASLPLARSMMLAIVWTLYSITLAWIGKARRSLAISSSGLVILWLAVMDAAVYGCHYQPVKSLIPVFNIRALAFILAAIGIYIHQKLFTSRRDEYPWLTDSITIFRVILSFFIFELISVETWDYFERSIWVSHQGVQMQQMALSIAWLIYSILLMSYGIWRNIKALRVVAIMLFTVSILKVFLYDLSSLETAYRTFSFIGLGLILMATSYLYTRFRSIIVGPDAGQELEEETA